MSIQIDHLYTDQQFKTLLNEFLPEESFRSFSPEFDLWRGQAREDLMHGRKVALGAWVVSDRYSGRPGDLAGACLLRKAESVLGTELELELIHVTEKYRNPHYYPQSTLRESPGAGQQIGRSLLKKAEELGQKYGYRRIVTRVPTRFPDIVFFLMRQQFIIYEYDSDKGEYLLSRSIEPAYNKDPYDIQMLVEWLCEKWKIRISNWVDRYHATGLHSIGEDVGWDIGVDILICQDVQALGRMLKSKTSDLKHSFPLIILKTEEALHTQGLDQQMAHYIDPVLLKREARNRHVDLTLQDRAVGVLVPIRKHLFDHFRPTERQVFFDGGEYGQILTRRLQDRDLKHAFIVFSNSDANNQEILGIGVIRDVQIRAPNELWKDFGKLSTFEKKLDFDRYCNIKTKMTSIIFEQLEVRTKPVDFSHKLSTGGWSYLSEDEFYRQILSEGDFPRTIGLAKSGNRIR